MGIRLSSDLGEGSGEKEEWHPTSVTPLLAPKQPPAHTAIGFRDKRIL